MNRFSILRTAAIGVVFAALTTTLGEPPSGSAGESTHTDISSDVESARAGSSSSSTEATGESVELLEGLNSLLDEDIALEDDLDLLFEDFDIVVTASRKAQSAAMSAAPVTIIDADDIKYSGVREIQELLEFAPGVDALRVGRNQWAIGVRGLHQVSSDRTLLLINGRNASNAIFGGFDLQRLPIFIHDIERIEIVRGPAGGAWGANAFNGVINIIEKNPRDTTGFMLGQRFNELGDTRTNLRYGDASDELAWRLSAEFAQHEATNEPFTNAGNGFVLAPARDFARTQKFALDGLWDMEEGLELDFGAAYAHTARGASPFIDTQVLADDRIDLFRGHARLNIQADDDLSGYIQWHGTFQDVNLPAQWRYESYDNALEGQIDFAPVEDHELTVGGTARFVNASVDRARITDALDDASVDDQWIGAFVSHRWTVSERWTLESQGRLDWYSRTDLDWAGRIALLRKLDEQGRHVLRLAGAKAFRTPQTAIQDFDTVRVPIAPGPPPIFSLQGVDPSSLDNEQLYSGEVGYTGYLSDTVTLQANAYFQRYYDLTGLSLIPEPPPQIGRFFFTFDNTTDAEAYGAELEIAYEHENIQLGAWYAYNRLSLDSPGGLGVRAFLPAEHKVGASARVRLLDALTLNANYRFTDTTVGPGSLETRNDPIHRLDLAATLELSGGRGELAFGVLDVFDQTDGFIRDPGAPNLGETSPGTLFFVEVRFSF